MNQYEQKITNDPKSQEKHKVAVPTIVYGGIVILAVFFGVFVFLAYFWKGAAGTAIGGTLSKVIPLPVAAVNYTSFISMHELQKDLATLRYFYENQDFSSVGMRIDFSTNDGKKRLQIVEKQLLDKLIEDRAVLILAKKHKISISDADVDKAVAEKLDEYGINENAEKDLQKRYGWGIEEFKENVVKPSMYQEKLNEKVSEDLDSYAKVSMEKAQKAQIELKNGKDFSEVVREYSDGFSAENGGEIGWVNSDQLLPEISEKIFVSNPEKYALIQSRIGFHIVDVEDRKKDGEEDVVRIRQIFVKSKTFSDWLGGEMKKMDIYVPIKGLYWDSEAIGVQFSDEDMKSFEKNSRDSFNGDASLFF